MRVLDEFRRRWRRQERNQHHSKPPSQTIEQHLIERFHQAARSAPAYQTILAARGVVPERIRNLSDFTAHVPVLAKQDLFGSFQMPQLCIGGKLPRLAGVLTSSGQGGRFAFGISTPSQAQQATAAVEAAMAEMFQTDRHRTLLVNALPMGVRFACPSVTVAETSVREDMVVALVEQFAPHHDQTVLVTDPLFGKRILDHSREVGLDWGRFRVHVILGEETFGEAYRRYLANALGQDPDGWTRGLVISSMGVGELGLNLFFETPHTVRLRQLADRRPETLTPAIGRWPGRVPPLLFVYDPRRLFVEILEPDAEGFGALTLSMLDPDAPIPLLRYRTGDRARIIEPGRLGHALEGTDLPNGPKDVALPMIALVGRETEELPDGRTLLDFKDSLYREPSLADRLTGAFRIESGDRHCRIHVQMNEDWDGREQEAIEPLRVVLPAPGSGIEDRIQPWSFLDFPYGRTLDYERKFTYHQRTR